MFNPDVTVRGRGVMEKCTYCVQRISRARRAAEKEHRTIRDGEVVTACQAACPTRAISFGDLSDANSRINALRTEPQLTRSSAISARDRALPTSPGCKIPIRILGASSHERSRHPQRPMPPEPARWTLPQARSLEAVNAIVTAPLYERGQWSWRAWWIGFAVSGALTVVFLVGVTVVLMRGIGVWGVNTTVVWGIAIANYVWWIGIGNAGTLISAMLLLMRQKWRASTNRFAEAMTLFAAAIAGIFPIIHLGRPMYFYWLTPYPNTMTVWPQWRSALIWDFWAILSYILFSIIFWYVGLIPDLATLRDRARTKFAARDVRRLRARLARLGAALARLRNAASGARLSRRAAGRLAAQRRRHGFRREPDARLAGDDFPALFRGRRHVFRLRHGGVPRRSGALGLSHAGADHARAFRRHGQSHAGGRDHHGAVLRHRMVQRLVRRRPCRAQPGGLRVHRRLRAAVLGAASSATSSSRRRFWFGAVRSSVIAVFAIAVAINIGMWLERILIVWNTLSHDYAVSMWRLFIPTVWDWVTTFGSLGLFALMYLVFVRLVPVVSMHEVRKLIDEEGVS